MQQPGPEPAALAAGSFPVPPGHWARTAALIDQLRAGGAVLTYDPDNKTLRADGHDAPSVTIGNDH